MGPIKRDVHDQIYISTGLDVDGRLDDLSDAAKNMDIYIRQMIAFMKLIPGFRFLRLSDQTALVKGEKLFESQLSLFASELSGKVKCVLSCEIHILLCLSDQTGI